MKKVLLAILLTLGLALGASVAAQVPSSPTFWKRVGTYLIPVFSNDTLKIPAISGTQCWHSINGVLSGTGSDCGSGGGGGATTTINSFSGPAFTFSTNTHASLLHTITGSGSTLTWNLQPNTGYNIPLTASTTNWNTAFGWGNHASAGYLTAAITSLAGQTGATQTFSTSTSGGLDLKVISGSNNHQFQIAPASGYSVPLTASTTEWALALQTKLSTTTAAATYEPILTKGNLTATSPLQFDNTRQVIGGAAALSVASGYNIPLTASTTEWSGFYNTPSTRITAGTNLSWSGNTLNATGGSGNAAWTIGSGLIYNATSTDLVLIGTSTPTFATLYVQAKAGSTPFAVSSSSGASLLSLSNVGALTLASNVLSGGWFYNTAATDTNKLVLNTSGPQYMAISATSTGISGNAIMSFGYTAAPSIYLTPVMSVVDNGRVGIGTTTPGQPLVVIGSSTITSLTAGPVYSTANGNLYIGAAAGGGTVTSVDMTVPTGLSISGTPITTSGTLALSLTSGYNIPLTASTTEWSTAYSWGNHAGLYPTFAYASSSHATLWNLKAGTNITISTSSGVTINGAATPTIIAGGTATGPAFTFATSTDTNLELQIVCGSSTCTFTPQWTGTLAAGRLNSNVVQAVTNDTNVTGSISSQNLTLGWTGVLAVSRGGIGTTTIADLLVSSSNLSVTGGQRVLIGTTTTITLTDNPTFTKGTFTNATTTNLTVSGNTHLTGLTGQNCLGTSAAGLLQAGSCGGSGNSAWTIGNGVIYNATSTDLVNIGTSTMSATLSVQGKGGANPFWIASSTGKTLLTVTQTGRLGLGTSTPAYQFHMEDPGKNITAFIESDAAHTAALYVGSDTVRMYRPANETGLRLYNTRDVMTLTTAGNVGVGTTTPAELLHVFGNLQAATGTTTTLLANTATQTVTVQNMIANGTLNVTGQSTIASTTMTGILIANGQYYSAAGATTTISTITKTIDLNVGNFQSFTLSTSTTLTLTNIKSGGRYLLVFQQDSTGSRTITWPAAVHWPASTAPTLTTTANKVDIVTLACYSASVCFGNSSLNFAP